MSTDWSGFEALDEGAQARFLLQQGRAALPGFGVHAAIRARVAGFLDLGAALLDGTSEDIRELMAFLEDPRMIEDFNTYTNDLQGDETALAALDIASYACAFTARVVAGRLGHAPLPDPVLEAVPDIWEYYAERARQLGL